MSSQDASKGTPPKKAPPKKEPSPYASLPVVTVLMLAVFVAQWVTKSEANLETAKTWFHLDTYRNMPQRTLARFKPVEQLTFDQWIDRQRTVSLQELLRNFQPKGTAEGVIVASPSTSDPDYWYTWTRDSAIVARVLVDKLVDGNERKYSGNVMSYIRSQRAIQDKDTLLGDKYSGGLGEVKYYVNYEPFDGEWGRPQQDGPASRVITLAKVAHHLLNSTSHFEHGFVKAVLYDSKLPTRSIIKADLEHIAKTWSGASFDLWEEVSGAHFYTLLTIHTALLDGAKLARRLDDPGAAEYYERVAADINPVLDSFWDANKGIVRVTKDHALGRDSDENAHVGDNTYGKASELDTAVLLAVLHSGTSSNWFGHGRNAHKVLSTLQHLRVAFTQVFPINHNRTVPALGRYPEDRYDGNGLSRGNPWYLCTLAAAELVYLTATDLVTSPEPLTITPESFSFYSSLNSSLQMGQMIPPRSDDVRNVAKAMGKLGDEFVFIVRQYGMRNGSLHEQFDLVSGRGRGARDLTWSYAAFLTAIEARTALKASLRQL